VVSVAHRSTLRNFHNHVLDVATFSPRREQLPAMSNSDLDLVLLGCHTSEMAHSATHSYCPLQYPIVSSLFLAVGLKEIKKHNYLSRALASILFIRKDIACREVDLGYQGLSLPV
jgi:hypothetical protein